MGGRCYCQGLQRFGRMGVMHKVGRVDYSMSSECGVQGRRKGKEGVNRRKEKKKVEERKKLKIKNSNKNKNTK
jgi:hypothetical protein